MRKPPKRVPQDRQLIKITVRAQLSGRVFVCFLACLIPLIFSWLLQLIPFSTGTVTLLLFMEPFRIPFSIPLYLTAFLGASFVTDPMAVRLAGFFLQFNRDAENLPSPLSVCDCFGPGYWRLFKGMLLRRLDILVWSVLPLAIGALVPGTWERITVSGIEMIYLHDAAIPFLLLYLCATLYRDLACSMTPYLLQDRPELFAAEAYRESLRMTRGRIFELLMLELSFFGWSLLASAPIYVGAIYAYPYTKATMAAYYTAFSVPMPWEVLDRDAAG